MNLKNIHLNVIIFPLLLLIFSGCGKKIESEPVNIVRLDRILPSGKMPEDTMIQEAGRILFKVSGYGELNDSSLAAYASSPSIILHKATLDERFPSVFEIENELGMMFGNMKRIYPDVIIPQVYSIISPFNQSVITVDTLLYIGLNHYFGHDYGPYSYFPEYVRKNKTRERIVPDVAETLVRKWYEYTPASDYPTVLSKMLYEGAVVDAVMRLTGMTEQNALGYDDEEMRWLEEHEKDIWTVMITEKMLYSTDETVANRLLLPSASTYILSSDAPGRIGRYIGYRIIKEYRDNNDISPQELLKPETYNSPYILSKSRYH